MKMATAKLSKWVEDYVDSLRVVVGVEESIEQLIELHKAQGNTTAVNLYEELLNRMKNINQ